MALGFPFQVAIFVKALHVIHTLGGSRLATLQGFGNCATDNVGGLGFFYGRHLMLLKQV
jgi:hypothetical protein